jgi:hypothetical protein
VWPGQRGAYGLEVQISFWPIWENRGYVQGIAHVKTGIVASAYRDAFFYYIMAKGALPNIPLLLPIIRVKLSLV